MSDVHTIEEVFELPSQGLIYDRPINPQIKLRSMTTQDEMLRLAPSEDKYRIIADLIDNCIIGEKPAISAYDMCMGDYTYLLHALRIVTYGRDYPITASCLFCGEVFETTVKLDELIVRKWSDDINELMTVTLPSNGDVVKLRYQTPRMMDDIARRVKQIRAKNKDVPEESENMLQKLIYSIDTINGKKVNPAELEIKVRNMRMDDTNTLLQIIDSVNESLGPLSVLELECPNCGRQTFSLFRYSSEFFRPTIRQ